MSHQGKHVSMENDVSLKCFMCHVSCLEKYFSDEKNPQKDKITNILAHFKCNISKMYNRRIRRSEDIVWDDPTKRNETSDEERVQEFVDDKHWEENKAKPAASDTKPQQRKGSQESKAFSLHHRKSVAGSILTTRTRKSQARRYSGGGDNTSLAVEWYATGWHRVIGFNLELWWSRSDQQQRLNAAIIGLLIVIFLLHLLFGIALIFQSFRKNVRNPYVCDTLDCQKASQWFTSTMNTSVDPCDNFYEFVCGSYHHEEKQEGSQFERLIKSPAMAVEFGENSILAKILRNYRNDPQYDQPVRYYQACLNAPKRAEFGLEALLDAIQYIFGTRNFSEFENTALSMEEIGSRMLKVAGHASYINLAFYAYPFIQILRPTEFATNIFYVREDKYNNSWNNYQLVDSILHGLLPHLHVSTKENPKLDEDFELGITLTSRFLHEMWDNLHKLQFPKDFDTMNSNSDFKAGVNLLIQSGFCPLMGIQLDIDKVYSLFIREEHETRFIDLMALKYYGALKICFAQPPSSFRPKFSDGSPVIIDNPKSAFVSIWLIELFWDYLQAADTKQILIDWNITPEKLPYNHFVIEAYEASENDQEFQCLIAMYRNLGYMPTIRYLTTVTDNPAEYIGKVEDDMTHFFEEFSRIFQRIPTTEDATIPTHLANIILSRGIYIDVALPLVSGVLDESSVEDHLNFTDDHLKNSIIGTMYTVEKGRQNWIGSTDPEPSMKWWGSGTPSNIRDDLLDLREPMFIPAEFVEVNQTAAGKGQWVEFLGRKYTNYVLYPLSLITEPHVSETMALYYAGFVQKILRSFLSVVEYPFFDKRYSSMTENDFYWEGTPQTANGADRKCFVLYNAIPAPPPQLLFQYTLTNYTLWDFTWTSESNFFGLLALKEGLKLFRRQKMVLNSLPLNYSWSERDYIMRTRRFLPGPVMSKFTEEQLYFITYVRQACRGSFKTHNDTYRLERWHLETEVLYILMQTEEFAKAWNCKKDSFMNNMGKPRCMRWIPDPTPT